MAGPEVPAVHGEAGFFPARYPRDNDTTGPERQPRRKPHAVETLNVRSGEGEEAPSSR